MWRLIRAVVRVMEDKRGHVVARDLLKHHDIVMGRAEQPPCNEVACLEHSAHRKAAEQRMHAQSHRLHVLQWKGNRFADEVLKESGSAVPVARRS